MGTNILHTYGLKKGVPTVLIFGGSRGAKAINDAILKNIRGLFRGKPYQIIYVTGEVHYENVIKELNLRRVSRECSSETIHSQYARSFA